MSQEQFDAIMPYICSDLLSMIVKKTGASEKQSIIYAICFKAVCNIGTGRYKTVAIQHRYALRAF